ALVAWEQNGTGTDAPGEQAGVRIAECCSRPAVANDLSTLHRDHSTLIAMAAGPPQALTIARPGFSSTTDSSAVNTISSGSSDWVIQTAPSRHSSSTP